MFVFIYTLNFGVRIDRNRHNLRGFTRYFAIPQEYINSPPTRTFAICRRSSDGGMVRTDVDVGDTDEAVLDTKPAGHARGGWPRAKTI